MPTFLAPTLISTASNYAAYGTAPAGSGVLRLSNGSTQAITWRNAANSNDIQALYVTNTDDLWVNTALGKNVTMAAGGAAIAQWSSLGLQFNPGFNIVTYGAGFKIGGSSAEKIAVWGATPIAQPANTVALDDAFVSIGLRASGGIANFTSPVSTAGLTGATAASRYVGATTSGAPATGTFVKGDVVVDQTGKVWVNTTAGSPGTFTQVGTSTPYWSDAKWAVD